MRHAKMWRISNSDNNLADLASCLTRLSAPVCKIFVEPLIDVAGNSAFVATYTRAQLSLQATIARRTEIPVLLFCSLIPLVVANCF